MGFVSHVGGPRHFDESWSCFDTVTTGQTDRQTNSRHISRRSRRAVTEVEEIIQIAKCLLSSVTELKCYSRPCLNNGSCTENFAQSSYECTCTARFGGNNCEHGRLTITATHHLVTSSTVCEASIFDSNSNGTSRFEFDSKVTWRFENFESAAHAVCRHTTNYAHSLFNLNINLCAVCS